MAATIGFWLNLLALMVVATSNGLAGVPSPLLELIYVACWPSALSGVPHENYFYPEGLRNMLINVLGWTLLGTLPSVLPARRSKGERVGEVRR